MIYKNLQTVDNPKGTVIIVHGIAEHSGRYLDLSNRLNSEGYDVLTYDHLGHGKSSGKRGKIKSFKEHLNVLRQLVLEQKSRNDNKIFLLGHSMGGGIVNLYGVTYDDVDGIVSVAAASHTPSNTKALKYTGFWYLRWVRINTKIFDKHLAHDPNVLASNKEDDLMLKYIYVSLIGEMFIKGVKYIDKNAKNFTVPVLYIHGTADNIVQQEASIMMYEKISSKDKEIKLYDGEFHELLNDYNKEEPINDIIVWLNKH